jgi:hypothetical protein
MHLEMAPQHWIWQADGFKPEHSPARLGGFLAHLLQTFSSKAPTIPNMAAVMEKIKGFVPTCREADRQTMMVLYLLCHSATRSLGPESEKFLKNEGTSLEECGIATLAVWPLFHEHDPEWAIDRCIVVFEECLKKRYGPNALCLPLAFEIAIMAQIANRFLDSGDPESFVTWIDRSTLEAAGRRGLQEYLNRCKSEARRIDPRVLLGIVTIDRPQGPTMPA